jgi:hypothetical protein
MNRLPSGYRGVNHQTIGSDLLSVLKVLHLPKQILGAELADKLAAVKPDGWYPISLLLDTLELLDKRLGPAGLRNVGFALFRLTHQASQAGQAHSVRDVVYGFDTMYHAANRGIDIGGWKVRSFDPGVAVLEKTTPHHCGMEEGILQEAIRLVAGIPANIQQDACFRLGAPACVFRVTSVVTDERWGGPKKP